MTRRHKISVLLIVLSWTSAGLSFGQQPPGALISDAAGGAGVIDESVAGASSSSTAAGSTLWVANNGLDSGTCGSRTKPCRSISQAIENAMDGDIIRVRPGRYGNVSGDINFGGPGDEHPGAPTELTRSGCMICITKALRIYSTHGAAVTLIDGSSSSGLGSSVAILHDGVTFGAKGFGFTISGGNDAGLIIDGSLFQESVVLIGDTPAPKSITVAGNVDRHDGAGFRFVGPDHNHGCLLHLGCAFRVQILLSDNESIENNVGFDLHVKADFGPAQILLRNNLTRAAGTGFSVFPGQQLPGTGRAVSTSVVQLSNNVALHGTVGFNTILAGALQHNTASGNSLAGFMVVPGFSEIFRFNSAIGNGGPGAIVNFSPDLETQGAAGAFAPFSQNNFIGNDRRRPVLSLGVTGFNPGPSAHCAVLNVGALEALTETGPPPVIKLQAGFNFWGSASGPQTTGPGDAVGGVCDQNGGITVANPIATTEFPIATLP